MMLSFASKWYFKAVSLIKLSDLGLQAFRPGAVDMTEEQMVVNANTITLTGTGIDLDVLLPDMDWYVVYALQNFYCYSL